MPVVSETKLEAFAVISGMGPTYFWFQFYKLRELGLSFGLTDKEAREAVSYMVKGTLSTMSGTLKKEEVLDLIPVKPMAEHETEILSWYEQNLTGLYNKLKS
jgi:pyrroline-5-carboxylate reductase